MSRSQSSWILTTLLFAGLCISAASTHTPNRGPSAPQPVGNVREVHLTASDQQAVPGWLIETSPKEATEGDTTWRKTAKAVVLLHMFRSEHTAWEPILAEFEKRGITTLAIDMRGHGENLKGPKGEDLGAKVRGRDEETFRSMYRDALAAVDWLIEQGYTAENIGLLGASVGCSIAIDTSIRREGLGPVGVLTPGLNYLGVNSEEHIATWGTRDLLIVTSQEESERGPAPLRAALKKQFELRQKKTPSAKDHVTYWVLPENSIHGTRMFGVVDGIEARIAGWFADRFSAHPEPASAAAPK